MESVNDLKLFPFSCLDSMQTYTKQKSMSIHVLEVLYTKKVHFQYHHIPSIPSKQYLSSKQNTYHTDVFKDHTDVFKDHSVVEKLIQEQKEYREQTN